MGPTTPAEEDRIVRILSVLGSGDDIYLLLTIYPQSDAMMAAGQVHLDTIARGAKSKMLLSVSDPLGAIWVSPQGKVWTASASGNVWTTAAVNFPEPLTERVPARTPQPGITWQSTSLPKLRARKHAPNVTAMFGFSDSDVFAGTFQGAVYHWDGSVWTEMDSPATVGIGKMHGFARDHLYAVGYERLVMRFDGKTWKTVPVPAAVNPWAIMTGVRAPAPDRVYACDTQGRVYSGDSTGLRVLTHKEQKWFGVAEFENRIILASAPGGAWEITGNQIVPFKPKFSAVDVYETPHALFFIEEEQTPRPSVIEFNPAATPSWGRRSY